MLVDALRVSGFHPSVERGLWWDERREPADHKRFRGLVEGSRHLARSQRSRAISAVPASLTQTTTRHFPQHVIAQYMILKRVSWTSNRRLR